MQTGKFSEKHAPHAQIDPAIRAMVEQRATNDKIPCAVAFAIAAELDAPPSAVGATVDLIDFRLTKCQLGLFGYGPQKKIVQPKDPDGPQRAAILAAAADKQMDCSAAWALARQLDMPKLAISNACEALGIKIRHCQIGAF
jgi:hypothetical protein